MFKLIKENSDLSFLSNLNRSTKITNKIEFEEELINLFKYLWENVEKLIYFEFFFKNNIIIKFLFYSKKKEYGLYLFKLIKKFFKLKLKNDLSYDFKNQKFKNFNKTCDINYYSDKIIFFVIRLIKYYNKLIIFKNSYNKLYFIKLFKLFFEHYLINLNKKRIIEMLCFFLLKFNENIEDLEFNIYIGIKKILIDYLNQIIFGCINYIILSKKENIINRNLIWEIICIIGNSEKIMKIKEIKDEKLLSKIIYFKEKIKYTNLLITSNMEITNFLSVHLKFIFEKNCLNKIWNKIEYKEYEEMKKFIINEDDKIYLFKYNIKEIIDNEKFITIIIDQLKSILNKNFDLFIFINSFEDFIENILLIKKKYHTKIIELYSLLFIHDNFDLMLFLIYFDFFVKLINEFNSLENNLCNYLFFKSFLIFIRNKSIEIINNRHIYNQIKKFIISIHENFNLFCINNIFIIHSIYFNNLKIKDLINFIKEKNYDLFYDQILNIDIENKDDILKDVFKTLILEIIFKLLYFLDLYLPLNWEDELKDIFNLDYYFYYFEKVFEYEKNNEIEEKFVDSLNYNYLNKLNIFILNKITLKYENILTENYEVIDFNNYINYLYKFNEDKSMNNNIKINYLEPLINKFNYFLKKYIDINDDDDLESKEIINMYSSLFKLYSIRDNIIIKNLNDLNKIEIKEIIKKELVILKKEKFYKVKLNQYFLIFNTDVDKGLEKILKKYNYYKNILSIYLLEDFENINWSNITNKLYLIMVELLKNSFLLNIDKEKEIKERLISSGLITFFLDYYYLIFIYLKSTNNYNTYYKIQYNMFIIINKILIKISNWDNKKIENYLSNYSVRILVLILKCYYFKFINNKIKNNYSIINEEFGKIVNEFFKFFKILLNINSNYKLLIIKNLNIDFEYIRLIFKKYRINDIYELNLLKNNILECLLSVSYSKIEEVINYLNISIIPFDLFNTSCFATKIFYQNNSRNNIQDSNDFKKYNEGNTYSKIKAKVTFSNIWVNDKFKISYNKLEDKYIYYSDKKLKFNKIIKEQTTISFKKEKTNFKKYNDKNLVKNIKDINYQFSNLNIAIYSFLILLNMKKNSINIIEFFKISENLENIKKKCLNIKKIFNKNIDKYFIKNDPQLSVYNKTSIYSFLKDFIISIEIIDEDRHYKVINFMKPNKCFFFNKYIKSKFLSEYDISSRENRLYSLIDYFEIFEIYSTTNKSFYKYVGFILRIKNKERLINFGIHLIYFMCLFLNFYVLFLLNPKLLHAYRLYLNDKHKVEDLLIFLEPNNERQIKDIDNINLFILILSSIFLFEFFFSQFYYNFKIQEKIFINKFEKNDLIIQKDGILYKFFKYFYIIIIRTLFFNDKFLTILIHLIFSILIILGFAKIVILLNTFHLFTIIFISDILKRTFHSIKSEFFKLLVVFIFILIILFLFSSILFFTINTQIFSDNKNYCETIWKCLYFNFRYSFFNASGLFSYMKKLLNNNSKDYFANIFQILFFFITKVIIFNVIQAIVLDSFSLNITKLNKRNYLNEHECFICGISRENFQSLKKNLEAHKNSKHSLENYFFYYIYLIQKNKKYFSKTEKYIHKCILEKNIEFFPLRNSKNKSILPEDNQ